MIPHISNLQKMNSFPISTEHYIQLKTVVYVLVMECNGQILYHGEVEFSSHSYIAWCNMIV